MQKSGYYRDFILARCQCETNFITKESPSRRCLPHLVTHFARIFFSFYAGMMVLQLIWVKTMVPETKGVPLEQIQKQLGIE